MEKRKPHYPLATVKDRIRQGAYRVTRTALQSAVRDFGLLDPSELAESVLNLEHKDFYKSMTSFHDVRLWQDVYRPLIGERPAYVKVQVDDEQTVIISFKLSEEESRNA